MRQVFRESATLLFRVWKLKIKLSENCELSHPFTKKTKNKTGIVPGAQGLGLYITPVKCGSSVLARRN